MLASAPMRLRERAAVDEGGSDQVGDARVAAIAQLVEHIIRNDGVGGSIPSCGTNSV